MGKVESYTMKLELFFYFTALILSLVKPGHSLWWADEVNKCELALDPGPCLASVPKWYYNKDTKSCEEFQYGGCQGNENKFDSERECYNECGDGSSSQPSSSSSNREPSSSSSSDNINAECRLPKDVGPCRARKPRYYFDADTGACKLFYYGGCQGNANNFRSMRECTKSCGSSVEERRLAEVDVCDLPMDRGLGYANHPKFYYNKNSRRCEAFSYGGAGGNGNRFNSIAECQQECGPASDGKCHEEKERLERENRGVLGAFIPDCKDDGSYETKQCHGSTGYCWCVDESGNEIQGTRKGPGRFRGCEEDKVGVCGLPVDRGLGYANLPKFYYNKNSRRCEVFSYGGAGGN